MKIKIRIAVVILFSCINALTHAQNSKVQKESDPCNFQRFITDPKTPALAKKIYLHKDWNFENDYESLALLDSLTAKDKSSRSFYFMVITQSESKSDGYYSEALGGVGYDYILNNTQEFASYFDHNECHTEKDLAIWANIVILELSIVEEGNFDKAISEDFTTILNSNCISCSTSQKETIVKFGLILKDKWNEFLKNQD